MIRNARFVPVVLVLAAALSACGSDDAETASSGTTETVIGTVAGGDGADASGADVLARFSSCGDVAPAVAQYIAGLQESPSNAADAACLKRSIVDCWKSSAATAPVPRCL